MEDKTYRRLLDRLSPLKAAAVAFSGGADSTLLLVAAREALADRVLALTVVTPYMEREEIAHTLALAAELRVRHQLLEMDVPQAMVENPPDRCYRCKHALYGRLVAVAEQAGFAPVLDGSNLDDLCDYRPGLAALGELGIASPLLECRIGKTEVRRLLHALGLSNWDKPTNACLLTRLPIGARITAEALQRIEEAERTLGAMGYDWVRVRMHGELARIEVAAEQRARLLADAERVAEALEDLGFRHVTLDLRGYRIGSMNPRRAD